MQKIRFGIIGCSRIAGRHAEHIKNMGELVAVCDTDERKAKSLAEKYHVSFFTPINSLLGNG